MGSTYIDVYNSFITVAVISVKRYYVHETLKLQDKTLGNNTKNIIDINGKRYDAVSGAVIQTIDGFRPAKAPSAPPLTGSAPPRKREAHAQAAHIAPHRPQKAATLMRSAVKKPNLRSQKLVAHTPMDVLAKAPAHQVIPKLSHTSVNPHREKRAKRVMQSPEVSRYGNLSTVDSLAARQAVLTPLTPQSPLNQYVSKDNAVRPVKPISHVKQQPDIFEQALARSTSHEQVHRPARSKKRGRFTTAVSAALFVLLTLGTFAYFNAPELSLRLASSRAGFEAHLPNYSPAGFSFGNLSYSEGNVTLSYKDGNNENRRFGITQRVSNWDSEGLLSNFVAGASKAYQTYERAGRTVYVYGDNTATWVDRGIWYTIDGKNSLTKNQVLDMAGSL